jgi:phospholipase/carboxylesterase
MGFYEGRAWFSIDLEELERSMREGTSRDLSHKTPPEFSSTMNLLADFVQKLEGRYEKIILGGFSQGAMCVSHLGLRENSKVEALILLSGSLLAKDLFPKKEKSLPFIQSHGAYDPILSLAGGKNLYQQLTSLGLVGKWVEFQGVHEIPLKVIEEVKRFLLQFAH